MLFGLVFIVHFCLLSFIFCVIFWPSLSIFLFLFLSSYLGIIISWIMMCQALLHNFNIGLGKERRRRLAFHAGSLRKLEEREKSFGGFLLQEKR